MVIERKYQHKNSQHGLSLIEVLVVLVILTIGILSVLRLFPSGFQIVRNAQNNSVAERFGQSMLETAKSGSMPDGIYTVYNTSATSVEFDPKVLPDDLGAYTTATPGASSGDLNKGRYIDGEHFSVPTPTPSQTSNLPYSTYVVHYGPIYIPQVSGNLVADPYLKVKSAPWTEHLAIYNPNFNTESLDPADQNGLTFAELLTKGKPEFLIDYSAKKLALPVAAYDQEFTLSIQGTVSTQPVQTYTAKLTVLAGNTGTWLDPTTVTSNTLPDVWYSGTAKLTRTFHQAPLDTTTAHNPIWDANGDPFEFAIPHPYGAATGYNMPGNNTSSAMNMGVLLLNPAGAAHDGLPALQASVSYIVYDWHILHEDHDVPSTEYATFRTMVAPIKHLSDIDADGNLYGGVAPPSSGSYRYDFMILDLDTGKTLPGCYSNDGTTSPTSSNVNDLDADDFINGAYKVSFKTGRITLPQTFAPRHIRMFYKASSDWGVAVQKAPRVYNQIQTTSYLVNPSALMPNNYTYDGFKFALFFPACDTGKSVLLSNITCIYLNGSVTKTTNIPSLQVTLSNQVSGGVTDIQLTPLIMPFLPTGSSLSSVTVGGVTGMSSRAIAIWREGDQWKQRAVDSMVGRVL